MTSENGREGPNQFAALVTRIGDWMFKIHTAYFFALVLGLCALASGVFTTPNIEDYMTIARHPLSTPAFDNKLDSYVLSSPLPALLMGIVGLAGSRLTFAVGHLMLLVFVLWYTMNRADRFSSMAGRLVLVAFVASPVSLVALSWLGQPDPLIIGGCALLLFNRRSYVLLIGGGLLAWVSFEQGLFIIMVTSLVGVPLLFGREGRVRHLVLSLVGVLAGRALLMLYQVGFGIEQSTTRAEWLAAHGLMPVLRSAISWWTIFIFSLFAGSWIIIGSFLARARLVGVSATGFVVAAVAALGVSLLTYDMSRVFALVSWPLLLATACWVAREYRTQELHRLAAVTLLAGLMLPKVLVGAGGLYGPAYAELVNWVRP